LTGAVLPDGEPIRSIHRAFATIAGMPSAVTAEVLLTGVPEESPLP